MVRVALEAIGLGHQNHRDPEWWERPGEHLEIHRFHTSRGSVAQDDRRAWFAMCGIPIQLRCANRCRYALLVHRLLGDRDAAVIGDKFGNPRRDRRVVGDDMPTVVLNDHGVREALGEQL